MSQPLSITTKQQDVGYTILGTKTRNRRLARILSVQFIYSLYLIHYEDIISDPSILDFMMELDIEPVITSIEYISKLRPEFYNKVSTIKAMIHDTIEYGCTEYKAFDKEYFLTLIKGTLLHEQYISNSIGKFLAPGWVLNRVARVVQALLRVAAYEIIYALDAKAAIIISEYIEIAKLFNHGGELGFVNGILDKIAKMQR